MQHVGLKCFPVLMVLRQAFLTYWFNKMTFMLKSNNSIFFSETTMYNDGDAGDRRKLVGEKEKTEK